MSTRALRVLAASDFYLPRAGGVERVVHESARRLATRGIAIEVLTRKLVPAAAARETIEGVPVHRVAGGGGPLALERLRLGRAVGRFCREELGRFDLVHAHLTLLGLPLLGHLERRDIPLVATFYGPWHREYLEELGDAAVPSRWPRALLPLARPWVARALFRMQRRLLAAARTVVVLSEHSRRELDQLGFRVRAPIVTIPGGVDRERFRPGPAAAAVARVPGLEGAGRPLLVAVRRLVPRMGLLALLDAVQRLQPSYPDLTLAVGGTGPLADTLAAEVRLRSLGRAIRLLGRVPEEVLPQLYAAADLTVLPTRALEGFGLPVLESWSAGVPVVATRSGALEELVGMQGSEWLSAGSSGPELARTIGAALARLDAEGGRGRAAERALALAESYSWESVADRLARLYHGLAGDKGMA